MSDSVSYAPPGRGSRRLFTGCHHRHGALHGWFWIAFGLLWMPAIRHFAGEVLQELSYFLFR